MITIYLGGRDNCQNWQSSLSAKYKNDNVEFFLSSEFGILDVYEHTANMVKADFILILKNHFKALNEEKFCIAIEKKYFITESKGELEKKIKEIIKTVSKPEK